MPFTKALYYPTIDIVDENWLRTAILFWDEIYTIVPSSIMNPYQRNSTQYLSGQGILKSIRVNPDSELVEALTMDTLNYLNTSEGFQLLLQGGGSAFVQKENTSMEVDHLFSIHHEKLPYAIQYELERTLTHHDDWFPVDSNFAMFYMTLLANKICERQSIALLSDYSLIANLTDKVRLNNQVAISESHSHYQRRHHGVNKPELAKLAQGLLTNFIIDGISVSDSTTLEDIVNFKRHHRDELGLFRTNIARLTQSISTDGAYEAMRQQVEDIYKDEFLPAYNNFKKALTGSRIKWVSERFLRISMISTSATAVPTILGGLSIPHALIAGIGVSLIASKILYNEDKKAMLREYPYSYLLAMRGSI